MRTSGSLGATVIVLASACRGASETAPARDAGSSRDATAADASVDTGAAAQDASSEAALDAGDAAAEAQASSCVGAAEEDAGTICSTASCVDDNWAQWPMPNSAAEVSQGAPNPASYTVPGNGTVTDAVTGLMWQETPPASPYAFADAASYCTSLTLAGHADWRLPAYVELVSIVDYSRSIPAIDPTAFPTALSVDVWASTLFASDTTSAWEIYFTAGDSSQDPRSGTNNVRCVRGPDVASSPAVPPGRYSVAGGGVNDSKTGLTWQQATPAGALSWADAKAYCVSLSDGGTSWRVPTAKELLTIVDVTRATPPAIDCEAFPAASASPMWSATPVASTPSQAWAVDFRVGYPLSVDASTLLGVRCVR
jgi:hypothetical protein